MPPDLGAPPPSSLDDYDAGPAPTGPDAGGAGASNRAAESILADKSRAREFGRQQKAIEDLEKLSATEAAILQALKKMYPKREDLALIAAAKIPERVEVAGQNNYTFVMPRDGGAVTYSKVKDVETLSSAGAAKSELCFILEAAVAGEWTSTEVNGSTEFKKAMIPMLLTAGIDVAGDKEVQEIRAAWVQAKAAEATSQSRQADSITRRSAASRIREDVAALTSAAAQAGEAPPPASAIEPAPSVETASDQATTSSAPVAAALQAVSAPYPRPESSVLAQMQQISLLDPDMGMAAVAAVDRLTASLEQNAVLVDAASAASASPGTAANPAPDSRQLPGAAMLRWGARKIHECLRDLEVFQSGKPAAQERIEPSLG